MVLFVCVLYLCSHKRDFKGQQNVGKLCWALRLNEIVMKTGIRSQVSQCIVHSLPSLVTTTSQEKGLNSKDIQRYMYTHLKSSNRSVWKISPVITKEF